MSEEINNNYLIDNNEVLINIKDILNKFIEINKIF